MWKLQNNCFSVVSLLQLQYLYVNSMYHKRKRTIHKLEKQIKSSVLTQMLYKLGYEIWSHAKISWIQPDDESTP